MLATRTNGKGVYDSAKILIWKQITTAPEDKTVKKGVYMTLQRY